MTDTPLYNVNCTGRIKAGHSPRAAVNAFARLANLDHTKAAALIQGRKTIKKAQPLAKAQALQSKLEALGVVIELTNINATTPASRELSLEPMAQVSAEASSQITATSAMPATSTLELSLEPIERAEPEPESDDTDQPEADVISLPPGQMACPRCGKEQPEADECCACGVIVAKAAQFQSASPQLSQLDSSSRLPHRQQGERSDSVEPEQEASNPKILMAAGAAAFVGALAWYWVAMAFNLELGLLAWAIGGLVGAAAVYYNASGENAGYLCGAMALVAILGGKYMVASTFTDQYFDDILSAPASEHAEFMGTADQALQDIDQALTSDTALRAFLVEYEYVYTTNPDDITPAELASYREDVIATRSEISNFVSGVKNGNLQEAFGGETTWEVFKASFGLLDILFLFLGVSTAFKMAREGSSIRSRL